MLLSKQWSRIAACVLAALVFLFLLKNLHVLRQYSDLLSAAPNEPATGRVQEPYQPKGEDQAKAPTDYTEDSGSEPAPPVYSSSTVTETTVHGPAHTFLAPTPTLDGLPHGLPAGGEGHGDGGVTSSAAAPSSTGFRKTIVMGKLSSEDTDWVGEHMKDWESAIYVVDLPGNATSPTGLRTKINRSKEAMPYLTYIVEHYETLPDVSVFIHAHRNGWPTAWHNDARGYDAVNMLNDLRLDTVEARGYANLRCVFVPGCPNEIQLLRDPPDDTKPAEAAYPFVYSQFFNMSVEEVRSQVPVIATQCCAQFAVSREQLLKRPKSEYQRFIALIEESQYDDQTLGTVMEYMWHILMGQNAVHCEPTTQCWQEVFGRKPGWS